MLTDSPDPPFFSHLQSWLGGEGFSSPNPPCLARGDTGAKTFFLIIGKQLGTIPTPTPTSSFLHLGHQVPWSHISVEEREAAFQGEQEEGGCRGWASGGGEVPPASWPPPLFCHLLQALHLMGSLALMQQDSCKLPTSLFGASSKTLNVFLGLCPDSKCCCFPPPPILNPSSVWVCNIFPSPGGHATSPRGPFQSTRPAGGSADQVAPRPPERATLHIQRVYLRPFCFIPIDCLWGFINPDKQRARVMQADQTEPLLLPV